MFLDHLVRSFLQRLTRIRFFLVGATGPLLVGDSGCLKVRVGLRGSPRGKEVWIVFLKKSELCNGIPPANVGSLAWFFQTGHGVAKSHGAVRLEEDPKEVLRDRDCASLAE
jgi:hypothetical protein